MCPTLGKSVFEISEKTWSEIPIIRLYIELMKKNPPEAEDYKQFLPFLKMSEENMDNLIEQFKAQIINQIENLGGEEAGIFIRGGCAVNRCATSFCNIRINLCG